MNDRSRPIAYLDGPRLARVLSAGNSRLVASQQTLNRINVFPVADGDTGTNMALTCVAMSQVLDDPPRQAGQLLTAAAEAALDGARGNSGAILAQFFTAVAEALNGAERIRPEDLARAFAAGATAARNALEQPRDGTVLTVLEDVAAAMGSVGTTSDFAALLDTAVQEARRSLATTPDQLDVLRKAGVVDAGAQGMVLMLEGMADFHAEGSIRAVPRPPEKFALAGTQVMGEAEDPDYQYCIECALSSSNIDTAGLRKSLAEIGGSIVVAGGATRLRIHIHANEPELVFSVASRFGDVSARKADDMRRQAHAVRAAAGTVAIITDSAADIPSSLLDELNIHVVPLRVQFGEDSYLDKLGMGPDEFFEELRTNASHPTTSQPPPGDFRRQYDFLASHFESVVSLHVSGTVSGTLQAAMSAADRCSASDRVTVVDTLNVSAGQGLLAALAAREARAGRNGAEVADVVKRAIPVTSSFGLVPDLSWAVRGGRLPGWLHHVARATKMTPVIRNTPTGRITTRGVLRARPNTRVRRFADFVRHRCKSRGPWRLAVAHADNAREAEQLCETLCQRLGGIEEHWLTDVGPVLGAHAGPGTLVASLQPTEIPEGQLSSE